MHRIDSIWKSNRENALSIIDSPWFRLICELQDTISFSTFDFYKKLGIGTLHLPITTESISSPSGLGSDSSPVKVNICGIETFLADSMQFYLELGCRFHSKGCFYIMPSFRGEIADSRHLCQFYHCECELPGRMSDAMSIVEQYLKFLCMAILEKHRESILKFTNSVEHIEQFISLDELPSISYKDAVEMLRKEQNYTKTGKDELTYITSEGEQNLIRRFGGIVWLTHIDKRIVPFYQADSNNDYSAECADLLFGIGEVVGLGQRHEDYNSVIKSLDLHNVSPESYGWYIDMKKLYPLQTSGFGVGIERFILWLLKHDDIRDCQLIPRFNGIKNSF